MRIPAPRGDLRPRFAFWALAGLSLLASHDAVFLVQVGPGEELARLLRSAAHDYWGGASIALGIAAAAAAATMAYRLDRLRRRARGLRASASRGRPLSPILPIWARLLAIVVVGFAIQENVEHFIAHGHVLGIGALVGPEHPLAIPVIAAITLAAAAVAALVVGTERALVDTITAAPRSIHRPAPRLLRPPLRLAASRASVLADAGAGRAPPRVLLRNS